MENGAWIKVKGVDFGDQGAAKFTASVAALGEGSTLTVRIDSEVGTAIGALKVNPTDGLDHWQTQSCKLTGPQGVHDVYFKFFGAGAPVMNIDWWKFEK